MQLRGGIENKMGQVKLIGGILMLAVFTIAIISYAVNFGIDNSADVRLGDDDNISSLRVGLKTDVRTTQDQSNDSSTIFSKSTIETDSDTFKSPGFVNTLTSLPKIVYSILNIGFIKIFGSDSEFGYVIAAFVAFLVILLVVYAWKTFRGNPD